MKHNTKYESLRLSRNTTLIQMAAMLTFTILTCTRQHKTNCNKIKMWQHLRTNVSHLLCTGQSYYEKVEDHKRVIRSCQEWQTKQWPKEKEQKDKNIIVKLKNGQTNPTTNRGWTQVFREDKKFLLHMWHRSLFECLSWYLWEYWCLIQQSQYQKDLTTQTNIIKYWSSRLTWYKKQSC